MSDIVERLRWRAENTSTPTATTPMLCAEAADEIARLRAEVDNLKRMVIAQEKLLRSKDAENERLTAITALQPAPDISTFAASQKPLGAEFEKVWEDNAADLYESQPAPHWRESMSWTECGPCGNVLCSQYGCQRLRHQPVQPQPTASFKPPVIGCICPPTSEQTCQNPTCPRGPSAHD